VGLGVALIELWATTPAKFIAIITASMAMLAGARRNVCSASLNA
jgi:hypothetical protein